MTPTTEVVAVVTLGKSSRAGQFLITSLCGECASKRRRAALSARDTAKGVVGEAQASLPLGRCHLEMIQMGALVAVLIIGVCTAPQKVLPSTAQGMLHASNSITTLFNYYLWPH